jgi:hydroxymethylpyrimidine/phosphomethylpyrimidine kinase
MRRPRLLSIAGSDSGGGAGIQADLKTFAAHGVYGMTAITAVTAQNTLGVSAVAELTPTLVAAQIDAVFDDLGVDAVKIGMLASAPIVRVVAERLRVHAPPRVVLDPVMVATSGDPLISDEAVEALRGELLPLATLLTPNLPEAARLLDEAPGKGVAWQEDAARRLAGNGPVLVKGGHAGGEEVVDLLACGDALHRFVHPRLDTTSTHGTGCTLSAAIASRLALGDDLRRAVSGAIDYLHGAIAAASPLGRGHGPVDHLYRTTSLTE